jgi:hypothetical protein
MPILIDKNTKVIPSELYRQRRRVPYEADVEHALQKLRQREFQAGRYNPVMMFPEFPLRLDVATPGPQHRSIEEVLENANEDGTRSILDITQVAGSPIDEGQMPFFTAFPLANTDVIDLFGTPRPTRQMVEANHLMWDRIERGSAIYVTLYDDDKPCEILFAGYSFD